MKRHPMSDGCVCGNCKMDRSTKVSSKGDLDRPLIAFIKGMPSTDESKSPFGKGGNVLRQILAPTTLDISRIMYTFTCICRSDKKNMPKKQDIRSCGMRLRKELKKARPKIVMPLGKNGWASLSSNGGIRKDRGILHKIEGHDVIPTIDPDELFTNPDAATDLVRDLNFAIGVIKGTIIPLTPPPVKSYEFIETAEDIEKFKKEMHKIIPKEAAIDLETTGLDPWKDKILSISITIRREHAYIIDWVRLIERIPKNKNWLNAFLGYIDCVYHNGMFDHLFLEENDIYANFVHDTMMSSYALDERQGSHSLKRIVQDNYHPAKYEDEVNRIVQSRRLLVPYSPTPPFTLSDWVDPVSRKAIAQYNGADSDYTFRYFKDSQKMMKKDHVDHIPKKLLIPASKHFIRLKQDGVKINLEYLESLGKKWYSESRVLEEKIREIKGTENLNLKSTQQVKNFIFNELQLEPMSDKLSRKLDPDEILEEIASIEDPEAQEYWRTASSAVFMDMKPHSTSMFMLYWLADQHPFPRYLLKHRLLQKRIGTYYEGYKKLIDAEGYLRPDYKIHGTRTGRLSSENPNIHGTPRIKEIKRMTISEDGFTFIAPDYSQAEIRMMAHFAKDEKLIQTLYELDIHRAISIVLFDTTEEEMSMLSKEDQTLRRRAAKTIAFGLIYGRGVKSLATQMGVDIAEAESFIDKYFRMMPMVKSWISKQHSKVIRDGEVISLYGRKRRFPFIPDKKVASKIKRQAVNLPIQSSVSDMTLLANIDIIDTLDQRKIPNKVGFHQHDGFMFQVKDECVDEAIEITLDKSQNVGFKTDVPFVMDIEVGKTWGDLKAVH